MKLTKAYIYTLILFSINVSAQNFEEFEIISGHCVSPVDIHGVDMDGDGDFDILCSSTIDKKICWFKNLGDGNYSDQIVISNDSPSPTILFPADLDNDGDMDFLSSVEGHNKLVWFENDGFGTFEEWNVSTGHNDISAVQAVDLNGDGFLDVLSGDEDGAYIWLNDGDGNFTYDSSQSTATSDSICAADFDGDGDEDLLTSANGWLNIKENLGDGDFGGFSQIYSGGSHVRNLNPVDLDQDGDMDILMTDSWWGSIRWLRNNGDGSFSQVIESGTVDNLNYVTYGDLNGDGHLDIISTSRDDNKIAWHENDGAGEFLAQEIITQETNNPSRANPIDIDGDGDLDLLIAAKDDDMIAILENDGSGTFGPLIKLVFGTSRGPTSVVSEDLDYDGDNDLVVSSEFDDKISWFENDGTGSFGFGKIVNANAVEAKCVISTDLNNDGFKDIVSASMGDDKIAWYANDGTANFSDEIVITTQFEEVTFILNSDIDNDGDEDILASSEESEKLSWYENNGEGEFSEENIIGIDLGFMWSFCTLDISGDGDMDVLCTKSFGTSLGWFSNDGDGNFSYEDQLVIFSENIQDIDPVDLDLDGDTDIVFTAQDDMIFWARNDGSGNFSDPILIGTGVDDLIGTKVGDLDGDGNLDVVCNSYYDDIVGWLRNTGGENFMEVELILYSHVAVPSHNGPASLFLSDLDGDYDLDVVTCENYWHHVVWMKNNIGNGCTDPEACNYSSEAFLENGFCCYGICGCTDPLAYNYDSTSECDINNCVYSGCINPEACNYDFDVSVDDGSCILPDGCTDPNALNYDSLALCDNESCDYRIHGLVFYDENSNGIFELEDYGLAFQEITSSNGETFLTNDSGEFLVDMNSQSVSFTHIEDELFPYNTTPNPQVFEDGMNETTGEYELNFGLSNEIPDFAINVDFYASWGGFPCDDWVNHNICFRNMGNVPINGIVEVEYDGLFQNFQEITEIDSIIGNILYMSFEDLLPGQMFSYNVKFLTPNAEFIGEFLTSYSRVYGYYEGEDVAFGEDELTIELTCSYDPNDKQVFPTGYEEPHYVLPETELEYLVRFQNTGNAPATNVIIRDTIDANLNMTSFQLIANSHSVITTIDIENHAIEFFFENIMLPDSIANEPDSHGLISYTISPLVDLEPETEINNTAHIYFDNNPPIITNTTWTTIYECTDDWVDFTVFGINICQGIEYPMVAEGDYIESYEWIVGDSVVSDLSIFTHIFEESGVQDLSLIVSNPLCSQEYPISLDVLPTPEIDYSSDLEICLGDSVEIYAYSEEEINWAAFENNNNEQTVSPITTSIYHLWASNLYCVNNVYMEVVVHPNPELEVSEDIVICMGEEITLTAISDDAIQWADFDTESEQTFIPELPFQVYMVTASNDFDCVTMDSVEVVVNVPPILNLTADQSICLGEEITLESITNGTVTWQDFDPDIMNDPTVIVSPEETTTFYIIATNEFECIAESEVTITVNPIPEAEFTVDGATLTAEVADSYQWLLEGETIEGATSQTYTATENGNYSVEITNEFDCSSLSDEVYVLVVGIESLDSEVGDIVLFPNPMQESSTLFLGFGIENYDVKIIALDGKVVRNYGIVSSETLQISRNDLSSGTYLIQISNESQIREIKLVIN